MGIPEAEAIVDLTLKQLARVHLLELPVGPRGVVDDGQGFDVSAVQSNGGGLGLVTMEERVNLIGGDISVVSEAGRGTTVRVRGRAATRRVDSWAGLPDPLR